MNNEYLKELNEFENKFRQEAKGSGSLSPYVVTDPNNSLKGSPPDKVFYIGYDIHLENLEALHFEGLKLPRWESLEVGTTEEKIEICQQSLEKHKSDYPFISRVMDTDQKIVYTPAEVPQLREECDRVLDDTNDAKVAAALLKFYIACNKAVEHQRHLLLIPN